MADKGFYRTWKARVNAVPRLQRFVQGGIGMSYPMLSYTDQGLYIRHFYHAADQIGPDTMLIGPARVLVTMDYEPFDILDMNSQPFDLPLFEDVEYRLSAEERAALRPKIHDLHGLYDQLLATYPEPPGTELIDEFAATLQRVVPPVLWPYYELLLGDLVPASQ
jgi:hypothetical protein